MKKWRHMERGGYESQWTVTFFLFLSFFFSKLVPNDERFLHISRQQGQRLPRWAKAQPPAVKQSCLCPQLGFLHTEHFHFYFLFAWLLMLAASMKVARFNSETQTQNLKNLCCIYIQAISHHSFLTIVRVLFFFLPQFIKDGCNL